MTKYRENRSTKNKKNRLAWMISTVVPKKMTMVSVGLCYLWYSVRCCVHELREVHHTLPLVLGDMDALDRGEAGIGISEVLQLEFPLGQPGPSQLHKHLPGQSRDKHLAIPCQLSHRWCSWQYWQHFDITFSYCWCYLVLEKNNQLRAEDEAAELRWLKGRGGNKERKVQEIKEKLFLSTLRLNLKVTPLLGSIGIINL